MQVQAVRRVCIPLGEGAANVRKCVLLVTADLDLREASTRALVSAGFDVLPASHSGHATLLSLTARRIDILVAELTSEDVSGPSLAARLRRQHPSLETVFVGQAGTPECQGVLGLPFTRDQLVEAVTVAAAAAALPAS
jgi:DNA-binding response OmpR family regulator